MCGIIGYVGKHNAQDILIKGLKSLEYRGYDSSGIAINNQGKIAIIKKEGKVINLEKEINKECLTYEGIGHTRWATHGKPNAVNAHPHHVGKVVLVHNGIIENYIELKNKLKHSYHFKSETDTEVACALIDFLYRDTNDKLKALQKAMDIIKGSYAFGIIFTDEPDTIYAIRKDSPLILAQVEDEYFIASDIAAILPYTNKYYLLNEGDIARLNHQGLYFWNNELIEITKKENTYDGNLNDVMKNGYKHFMLKEIHDEGWVYQNIIRTYIPNYHIKDLIKNFGNFKKYQRITIVGCGSAYHAGMIAKNYFEEYANIPTSVEMASEYRYKKIFPNKKELVILISQSGETADTLEALRIAKKYHMDTLGIINVLSSSIARESDKVIYTLAGVEIAVATTKAYLAQVLILGLLALLMAYEREMITKKNANIYLSDLKKLIQNTNNILAKEDTYQLLAKKIYREQTMFLIGREIDYALCMESSLKLKEISYIHSEAYAAGELKHGTISLVEKNTPVIGIVTDLKIASKTISNLKETTARGARIILVITDELLKSLPNDEFYEDIIIVPKMNSIFQPLIIMTPMQLLAYYIALLRGENIDQPRNLAKSVTVE